MNILHYTTIILLSIFGLWASGQAATVSAVNGPAGTIRVDGASTSGLDEGDLACVYSAVEALIGCGRVISVNGNSADIRVPRKIIKSIRPFYSVRAEVPAERGRYSEGAIPGRKRPRRSGPQERSWLRIGHLLTAIPSYQHNNISYQVPKTTPSTTLWQRRKSLASDSLSLIGISAEAEWGLSGWSISTGLSYSLYSTLQVATDYSNTDSDIYAESLTSAQGFGIFSDIYLFNIRSGQLLSSRPSIGIGADSTTINFSTSQKSDVNNDVNPIATIKSRLTVVSLRLGMPFQWLFSRDGSGISIGVYLLLPILSTGKSFDGLILDAYSKELLDDRVGTVDLETSLAHQKSKLGILMTSAIDFPI